MTNLLSAVSEYFLGTETHRYYNRQRSFYREFLSGGQLNKKLKRLRRREVSEIASNMIIWDLMSLSFIYLSVFMKKPLYPLLISEGCRLLCIGSSYRITRKLDELTVNFYKNLDYIKNKRDEIENEGEEWKNPVKYHLKKQLDDIMNEGK